METSGACWLEMTTEVDLDRAAVDVADGDLGLAVGTQVGPISAWRTAASRSQRRCASVIGIGMSDSVSSVA